MGFLKKYFERFLLAVVSLVLIALIVWLAAKVGMLKQEVGSGFHPTLTGVEVKPMDLNLYDQALANLSNPPLWTIRETDLFSSNRFLSLIVPPPDPRFPVLVLKVERKPFDLLFKSYSHDAQQGRGYNFQINFREFTFFIDGIGKLVKNQWNNTGYQISKFEKKATKKFNPSMGREVETDLSELTLEHSGEKPVTLTLGQQMVENEPVASICCPVSQQKLEIRRAQRFVCDGKSYYVVDISSKQMVIMEEQGQKEYRCDLPGAAD